MDLALRQAQRLASTNHPEAEEQFNQVLRRLGCPYSLKSIQFAQAILGAKDEDGGPIGVFWKSKGYNLGVNLRTGQVTFLNLKVCSWKDMDSALGWALNYFLVRKNTDGEIAGNQGFVFWSRSRAIIRGSTTPVIETHLLKWAQRRVNAFKVISS